MALIYPFKIGHLDLISSEKNDTFGFADLIYRKRNILFRNKKVSGKNVSDWRKTLIKIQRMKN